MSQTTRFRLVVEMQFVLKVPEFRGIAQGFVNIF